MGKYIKKPKTTRDVGVMDVSLGVRTRAKTLALQSSDYLELRSRRLHKPPFLNQNSPKSPPKIQKQLHQCSQIGDSEIEASFGENNLDAEATERCTRESTPCSMIRAADTITTPGSSTKRRSPTIANQRTQNMLSNIPTAREMEEFFAYVEQPQQLLFIEKYNFDIVNDLPLPGRYEWVRVMP